ncbi:MAG: ABC transporter substrate-binding protein [candidate division NC10 bacterium]|nr:ABC transporter substrate-binding protein [candidate division NC10 bacterium]
MKLTLRVVAVMVLALLAAPLGVEAQQAGKMPRIGMLLSGAAPPPGQPSTLLDAFRGGLRDLGYVEGQNVVIEYRWSEGRDERFSDLAADLVRLNVAVIVTSSGPAVRAAKAATSTIPIVMAFVSDPVRIGVVASLARPGANVTGLSLLDEDLDGKRIELLKEAVPGLTRIAILWSANDPGMTLAYNRVEVAARALGLFLQSLAVREPGDFPRAFQAAGAGRAEALIVTATPFTVRHRAQILDLAAKHRLPAMYTLRAFVDAGGLMAYGPSLSDLFWRAVTYVHKILNGAKPGDLPVEQPTNFELVINLKTAQGLGLTIPPSLLLRADHMIE